MKLEGEQVLCRFHLTNYVQVKRQPLYEVIAERAHQIHMAGATVLKGIMGFSGDGPLLIPSVWSLSHEVPVIVEVVDAYAHILRLIQALAPDFHGGVITLERAHVVYFRTTKPSTGQDELRMDAAGDGDPLIGYSAMPESEEGVLLRIFLGDGDVDAQTRRPLYEALVRQAHEMKLGGATVLRGAMGFGKHSHLHSAKLFDVSTDLPVVVEIVDSEKSVEAFLPHVDALLTEGLVTLEKVRLLRYGSAPSPQSPPRPTF